MDDDDVGDKANETDPMSLDDDNQPPKQGYEIGYRKPPKAYRFRKGVSGNPGGRPKKPKKSVMQELNELLAGEVEVRSDGKPVRMSRNELFVRRRFDDAMQGKQRAIKPWLKLADQAGLFKAPPDPFPRSGVLTTDVAANPKFWEFIDGLRDEDDDDK